jgi:uncharacterized protein YdhG (YjbR/CyaY superfamily)
MATNQPTTIDEYIEAAPEQARKHLRELRAILVTVAPNAKQRIKWGSPVFEEDRILFSFSAHKEHINFMPTRASLAPFQEDLRAHRTGKDTLQLPYDRPLPTELIRKLAAHRAKDVRENGALWMSR